MKAGKQFAVFLFWGLQMAQAQVAANRYTLILEDPPVAERFATREGTRSAEAKRYQAHIETRQKALKAELMARHIEVTGSVSLVLNAVFVVAPAERLAELKSLPGVKSVSPGRVFKRKLSRATQLMNAPAAWSALGGQTNAGRGVKIAIIDTGIEHTNASFKDPSLPMPSGYPLCTPGDCAFTSNKVIVARSYVRQLAAGSAGNPAADSRPDDYSARDRSGHGTATASCAAGTNAGGASFSGMAPGAYLGNYKIYGSPGVNDGTLDSVIIQAIEDAFQDGMDIASFSSGGAALTGPLDTGAACGNAAGVPCDLVAKVFEDVAKMGMVVVAAGGNEGQDGLGRTTFGSIDSPGNAPSVISVGATTNAHSFVEAVYVPGSDAPSNLKSIAAQFGAYVPPGAIQAPMRDLVQIGADGYGCSALPAGSLLGTIAIIQRGPASNPCTFATKLSNAIDAGAIGVIFYMADASTLISPAGLGNFVTPAVMVSNVDGLALRDFAASHPNHAVVLDPAAIERSATPNQVASFSSVGPSTGDNALKPDIAAVGTNVYMAAETYDPLGDLYGFNGVAVADGTSFATPIVSGAAALVKQAHPAYTPAQVKSALVNAAAQDLLTDDQGIAVDVRWVGGGKLDAGAAAGSTVTVAPPTISFGAIGGFPKSQVLTVTNNGAAAVNLSLTVAAGPSGNGTTLTLDRQSMSLAPGASGTVTATLGGAAPGPGAYSGAVAIQGQGVALRVPYLYLAPSGVPADVIPLTGFDFDGTVGQGIGEGLITLRVVDRSGIGVSGVPVSFAARGGGSIKSADSVTDAYGIAAAEPVLGPQVGSQTFVAVAAGNRLTFSGYARQRPVISGFGSAGAANAGSPVAAGSYVALFGSALSDLTDTASTSILPLSIDGASVSFDVPSAGISVPGHLTYASPGQVNVQIPWELRGQTSAQVKITIGSTAGQLFTIPLIDYAPAIFETSAGNAAALDLSYRVIGAGNAARRGQVIQLFVNGLGLVTNQPASGDPASAAALSRTTALPVVTIGGQAAAVGFAGLAPGFAGLYQINVTVPALLSPGQQTVTVSIGGRTSKASAIPVQ
ncbi:MAG: S8 family serine peptidase [Bryobacteraceae bacterium]